MQYKKLLKNKTVRILGILLVLAVAAVLIYQIPPVKQRLSWRLEYAMIYARRIFDPAKAPPPPAPPPQGTPQGRTPDPALRIVTYTPTPGLPATATPTPVLSPTPTLTPTPIPGQVLLTPGKHEAEDQNACGPATLAMYLRYYGWTGDQYTISKIVKPVRSDRNVNVEELIYYSRNHTGWLTTEYRVGGDLELLKKLLAAGIPVMIEEGFILDESFWPNDDRWAGHYLLVNGYDEATQFFTVQDSERGPNQMLHYTVLKRDWQAFNYVYILLYPPDKQAAVESILGDNINPDTNRQNALDLALAEINADPNDAFAWFNLGTNYVYFDRYQEAVDAFDRARAIGLPTRFLRYQFGPYMAYFHELRTEDLMALTKQALDITPNSEEARLWRGWGYYRLGEPEKALYEFVQALEAHPGYADAEYAINYLNGQ